MQAIFIAKKEDNDTFEYNEDLIKKALKAVDEKLHNGVEENASIENNVVPDNQLAYDIFKDLNDKKASKASTAQYLADLLLKTHESEKKDGMVETSIQKILRTDENLRYLVDAIYHVTES